VNALPPTKPSVFSIAAWCGLLLPVATVVLTLISMYIDGPYKQDRPWQRNPHTTIFQCAFLAFLCSAAMAIFSLFGIRRHGQAIVWKAAIGLWVNCGLAFVAFCMLLAGWGM
jgi:hypothetical protein